MQLKKSFALILFTALLFLSGYEVLVKLPMGDGDETARARFVEDLKSAASPQKPLKSPRVDYQDILNTGGERQ